MSCFAGFSKAPSGEFVPGKEQAAFEAATKLSANFAKVVQDITNPGSANIDGNKLTQRDLKRVSPHHDAAVRAMLSAVCCRLVGKESAGPSTPEEAQVWLHAARFLTIRLQGASNECPGRKPDMTAAQAEQMLTALAQIEAVSKVMHNYETIVKDITNPGPGGVFEPKASQPELQRLDRKHQSCVEAMLREVCSLVLGKIPAEASGPINHEAAQKLMANRDKVVMDITNPDAKQNIDGLALTQTELVRVNIKYQVVVDAMVSELCCRLQGNGGMCNPSSLEEWNVWAATARYLAGRVQGTPEQMKGRTPDMSSDAAEALRGQCALIVVQSEKVSKAGQEAAKLLEGNRARVVQDICNAGPANIDGKSLSQPHLARLDARARDTVDAMVRAVCASLQGGAALTLPSKEDERRVWAGAARFLSKRVQGSPQEMIGRAPDMSPGAATALRMVLEQISQSEADDMLVMAKAAGFFGSRIQEPDTSLPGDCDPRGADLTSLAALQLRGKLGRMEASYKLTSNRQRVIQDIVNHTPMTIDGTSPVTQSDLERVDPAHQGTVDAMVKSLECLLLGQAVPGPSTEAEAQVWVQAAVYLSKRIQDDETPMRSRASDMSTNGATAMRQVLGQLEACGKLMSNHNMVVQDITNGKGAGVFGGSLTQLNLKRLGPYHEATVSNMVREVCSRLLGKKVHEPTSAGETQVWADAAVFLTHRIQSSTGQCRGRAPDMSECAALTLRSVLKEIANHFQKSDAPKQEAARMLMANRERVVLDITNPGPTNIEGKVLTQPDLQRVLKTHRATVDAMIGDVCCRLLGKQSMSKPSTLAHLKVWVAAARYLSGRVQGTPEEMPGRAPDMSSGAAVAMRAALANMICQMEKIAACGEEAARLLEGNRARVVQDITNQGPQNIDRKELTQKHLTRLPGQQSEVDAMIRQVCTCLKGGTMSTPSSPSAFKVWADAARYLSGCVQGSAEEMRGRKPDMSRDAAAALRLVLGEIVESEERSAARQEAGKALNNNRQNVVNDICNPKPRTQQELTRLAAKDRDIVDRMVSEVANQLQGNSANSKLPSAPEEMQIWAAAACYLAQRVQGAAEQMPGRAPDMSAAATKSFCTVLGRIEAGCKLGANRVNVVQDITNPAPLTQKHLPRVDAKFKGAVDTMVREVSACLGGKTMSKPSAQDAQVWKAAALFLSKRVQGTSEAMRGRKPDMSSVATAELCSILNEIAF
jgi:hypothetical protein